MGVKDYDLNPDNNTQINGINIAEGCPPSGINNAMRQLMADVKEDSDAQNTAIEALETKAETPASAEELGPVKVGDGLSMGEDGTLSADLATADAPGMVKASTTAQAGAVPLGGDDGSLGEDWLKKAMDAAKAAQETADGAFKGIEEKGARTSKGSITLTDCDPKRLLYMVAEGDTKEANQAGFLAVVRSGGAAINGEFPLGNFNATARGYVRAIKVTSATVVVEFTTWTLNEGWAVKFYQ